jgi:hypothetical protein
VTAEIPEAPAREALEQAEAGEAVAPEQPAAEDEEQVAADDRATEPQPAQDETAATVVASEERGD